MSAYPNKPEPLLFDSYGILHVTNPGETTFITSSASIPKPTTFQTEFAREAEPLDTSVSVNTLLSFLSATKSAPAPTHRMQHGLRQHEDHGKARHNSPNEEPQEHPAGTDQNNHDHPHHKITVAQLKEALEAVDNKSLVLHLPVVKSGSSNVIVVGAGEKKVEGDVEHANGGKHSINTHADVVIANPPTEDLTVTKTIITCDTRVRPTNIYSGPLSNQPFDTWTFTTNTEHNSVSYERAVSASRPIYGSKATDSHSLSPTHVPVDMSRTEMTTGPPTVER